MVLSRTSRQFLEHKFTLRMTMSNTFMVNFGKFWFFEQVIPWRNCLPDFTNFFNRLMVNLITKQANTSRFSFIVFFTPNLVLTNLVLYSRDQVMSYSCFRHRFLLYFRRKISYEDVQLICYQLTGFYMKVTLAFNELMQKVFTTWKC